MLVSADVASVSEWANDSRLSKGAIVNRKAALLNFEKANRAAIDQIIADIKADRLNVYNANKRFVEYLCKHYKPYTAYIYRSMIFGMCQTVLGEENVRKTIFERLVPKIDLYVSIIKKPPTLEGLRVMLQLASPRYRAILGLFAVTGMRVNEVLTRTAIHLEQRPDGHARISLRASETKARASRYVYVTREVMDWIRLQKLDRQDSEYLFPQGKGHLSKKAVQTTLKRLYARAGFHDSPDGGEIYCTHSMRTFAGDFLRNAGMSEKAVLASIGHVNQLAAEAHYLNWDWVEQEFVKCAPKLALLDRPPDPQIAEVKGENTDLKALLAAVLKRIT